MTLKISISVPAVRLPTRNDRKSRLKLLDSNDESYEKIVHLFQDGWLHKKKSFPHLYRIFRIETAEALIHPYLQYYDSVRRVTGKASDIEQLLFHGTFRACALGETEDNVRLCRLAQCSLCSIIRSSFDIERCGTRRNFSRFGQGIYTTKCSSKADDYCSSERSDLKLRLLLVNTVVVGWQNKCTRNKKSLNNPGTGYHSVLGVPGGDLNYEETVVYNNDAIRPAFLVVYGEAPPVPPKPIVARAAVRRLFTAPLVS
ncbi:ADP-ribosylation [Thelephora terrestris]|uniref:ADP-ribosylation n=1 Tax=Thelephora terrestris TaxID=56493 RepID=A0A9P6HMH9_9AGAM|nr:ADP-ribosylation [Thelephora terrestris]